MQQSNGYIIGFSVVTTIVLGTLLALAAEGLKPAQLIAKEKDIKKQILGAVIELKKEDDVLSIFDKRIPASHRYVVDYNGDKKEVSSPVEKIDIGGEYKKDTTQRLYPVFEFMSESNPDEIEAYIIPVYGSGLWDKIWGYLAIDKDLKTVKGVVFDHKGETPGLGARISDKEIQIRYVGKKLFDEKDNVVSVYMLKSEKGNKLTDYQVDGMSGATLTANGVNSMIKNYLSYYQNFFDKQVRSKQKTAEKVEVVMMDSTQQVKPDSLAKGDSTKTVSVVK